jgi:hypothetical protein
MVDIQTVSIAVASTGVLLAAIYYIIQIRHQTKLRQTDIIMKLYSTFNSREHTEARLTALWLEYKDYKDFVEKYDSPTSNRSMMASLVISINYFNEVGMLLHKGFIDIESLHDLFGYRVTSFWKRLKPLIEEWRKEEPQTAKWFEYVYNEMEKREQKLQQSTAKGE